MDKKERPLKFYYTAFDINEQDSDAYKTYKEFMCASTETKKYHFIVKIRNCSIFDKPFNDVEVVYEQGLGSGYDFDIYPSRVKFQTEYNDMHTIREIIASYIYEYWNELTEPSPSDTELSGPLRTELVGNLETDMEWFRNFTVEKVSSISPL